MMKKLVLLPILLLSSFSYSDELITPHCATYTVAPEIKIPLANMTLGTMIGATLFFTGKALDKISEFRITREISPENTILSAFGILIISGTLIYNFAKLAAYIRKSARAELEAQKE